MLEVLQLVLGVAISCAKKQEVIERITELDEDHMLILQEEIEDVLDKHLSDQGNLLDQSGPSNDDQPRSRHGSFAMLSRSGRSGRESLDMSMDSELVSPTKGSSMLKISNYDLQKIESDKQKLINSITTLDEENKNLKSTQEQLLRQMEADEQKMREMKEEINLMTQAQKRVEQEASEFQNLLDKIQNLEGDIQVRDQKLASAKKNFDQVIKDVQRQKTILQEEVEIAHDKDRVLQRERLANQQLKKKLEDFRYLEKKNEDLLMQISHFEDNEKKMKAEVQKAKQTENAVKYLKENSHKKSKQITKLEIQLQEKDIKMQDLDNELKIKTNRLAQC